MPTDLQLQLALAKMLPEKIKLFASDEPCWVWSDYPIRDTEWLHVCWLVEQMLDRRQQVLYTEHIENTLADQESVMPYYEVLEKCMSASWQQRALALCKVKGVEI